MHVAATDTYTAIEEVSYVTTNGQSASLSRCQAPIWGPTSDFYFCQAVEGLLIWVVLSDKRTGLSFTISAGLLQCSHSWVRVTWDWWPHFTVSDWRLPQPGWPGPHIYIPPEQGGPVIPPGTGLPSCHVQLKATVEVFEPASMHGIEELLKNLFIYMVSLQVSE
jgi:hypothetical protein